MSSNTASKSRAILGLIAFVVVASIATAAVLSATRRIPDLDPATPEGVAQAYFKAVLDADDGGALALMAPELRDRCDDPSFRPFFSDDMVRVVLVSSTVAAGRAVVEVDIDHVPDPSPFDVEGYSSRERLVMHPTATGWEIAEPPWPYFCPEGS